MIVISKSLLVIVGAIFASTTLFAQSAFAAAPSNQTKPGWGNGDKNHVHTGPPGQSVKTGNQISFSTPITIIAEKGAKVVVNIFSGITHFLNLSA